LLACLISVLIETVSEFDPMNTTIHLQLSSYQLKRMIQFMKHYNENPMGEWCANFVNGDDLKELSEAANYLDIEPLIQLTRAKYDSLFRIKKS
jgi:hypothetical protein